MINKRFVLLAGPIVCWILLLIQAYTAGGQNNNIRLLRTGINHDTQHAPYYLLYPHNAILWHIWLQSTASGKDK